MAGHATMVGRLSETAEHLREQAFQDMPSNQHGVAVFDVDGGVASDWPDATF